MQGKIIKGIAGFYYVHVVGKGVYECKAKGIFRNRKEKPLVGDNVEIEILDEAEKKGNIEAILPRENSLIRPAIANISQALVIFAAAKPEPNLNLLDRFLITMEMQGVRTVICFNKADLIGEERKNELEEIYTMAGYQVLFSSAMEEDGIEAIKALLPGQSTTVAGPSGVGKSSLINLLQSEGTMATGAISEKIERGKQTTRHTELFYVEEGYICDTPGFSSLFIPEMEKEELQDYFPEFDEYLGTCRFLGCQHYKEPDCSVKEAVENGKISRSRYDNYILFYEELKQRRKY